MSERSALRGTLIAVGQALLIAGSLYLFLRGWRRDFHVPFRFSFDSLQFLVQSKSTVDGGWWWSNSRLSAPFTFDALAFPANANVDQAIVWLVSRFVGHALEATNITWMVMVVLSGLSATFCMRALGVSAVSAVVAGTLFALSPYALIRNIDYFCLAIYLVPFPCAAAVLLTSGRSPGRWFRGRGAALTFGCLLLGFNYVYYAFFACFLIGVGALVGFCRARDRRILGAGCFYVALIAGCTVLNLAPSLYSWHQHGKPIIVREKVPGESEVYGLKIRQLISPVLQHSFPPFRWWTEKEASGQFPLETENEKSRLGFVGTLGFLGLLVLLFVPWVADRSDRGETLLSASRLTLAAVLLGTIGGFGSLFSLLVSSEIRGYNRITAFIVFFSLLAVALAMDWLGATNRRRTAIAATVLVLGLYDQGQAAHPLNVDYPGIAAEIPPLEAFVRQLESRLPDRAMVLQLPFRVYLNDDGVARMKPYDHFKPYLVSRTLHLSYPALSNEQFRWQTAAAGLAPQQLVGRVAAEGFAAVLIDRYGYEDNGASVTAAIHAALRGNSVLAQTDRYVALDIRGLAGASLEVAAPAAVACPGPVLGALDAIGMMTAPPAGAGFHVAGSSEFRVSGWAVDQVTGLAASGVDVLVDRTVFPSLYGVDRPDVADYFKRPAYRSSGFVAAIQGGRLSKGPHPLALRVVSSDGKCYYQTPTVSIIID